MQTRLAKDPSQPRRTSVKGEGSSGREATVSAAAHSVKEPLMATAQLSQQAVTTHVGGGSSRTRGQTMWGYLLIAPMRTGCAICFLCALVVSLGLSMTNWEVLSARRWGGLSNYSKLPRDA